MEKENDPTILQFNITPFVSQGGAVSAIAIMQENSTKGQPEAVPIQNLQINLTDPQGIQQDVYLCSSVDPDMKISAGTPFYIIKRNKPVFFIVDSIDRGGCGGGGGGSGSRKSTNNYFSPKGVWEIQISRKSDETQMGSWKFMV